MKKLICLAIATLMLLSVLVACGGGSTTPPANSGADSNNGGENSGTPDNPGNSDVGSSQTPAETNDYGEEKIEADVPKDVTYNNMEIGIASRPEERYRREISVAEVGTDPLFMAIDIRNRETEKRLGVKINYIEALQLWGNQTDRNIPNYVKSEVNAGANSKVDIIFANAAYTVDNAMRGYVVNFNDERVLKYMNINKGYWNQDYVSKATVYDQLYYLVGDINLTVYDKSIVTFVNFNKAKSGINVDNNTFYNKVENGEWTFKQFSDYVTAFTYLDKNNSSTVDAGDDIKITSVFPSEAYDGYFAAFNITTIQTGNDGKHTLMVAGNERLKNGAVMVQQLYNKGQNASGIFRNANGKNPGDAFKRFSSGDALFLVDILYRNANQNTELRSVDFNYGILPMPLYDENQFDQSLDNLGYYTSPQDAYNAISVLTTHVEKMDAISATLEILAEKSYNEVRPLYIEKMVKADYAQDAKSVKMIEIVLDGSIFETGIIYSFQMNRYAMDTWRSVCSGSKYATIDEYWATISTKTAEAIKAFDMFYEYQGNQ